MTRVALAVLVLAGATIDAASAQGTWWHGAEVVVRRHHRAGGRLIVVSPVGALRVVLCVPTEGRSLFSVALLMRLNTVIRVGARHGGSAVARPPHRVVGALVARGLG